jgi:RNA polymerase sigma-70 factor (ECF subfamily)
MGLQRKGDAMTDLGRQASDDSQHDAHELGSLFEQHRDRLRRLVDCRMDPRLRGRIDPSDVLQETFLEATARYPSYLDKQSSMPFFLWLRLLTTQRLALLHRVHLQVKSRSVTREEHGAWLMPNQECLVDRLIANFTTPGYAAIRAELKAKLHQALATLSDTDRDILALRHFEQLTNGETAQVLGIRDSAASHRYARALMKLKNVLGGLHGVAEEARP